MSNHAKYVLIGGGIASVNAATKIREADKEGRVIIVGAEKHMPYDRPPLSKNFLTNLEMTPDDASTKFDNFYPDNNIELMLGTKATRIDPKHKTVSLDNGASLTYEKLLIATGSTPKHVEIKGIDNSNVCLLRTIDDALAIRAHMETGKKVVIIGSGYIGLEVAAQCSKKDLDVTIISQDWFPWSKFCSEKLGGFLRKAYEDAGVKFLLKDSAAGIQDGQIITQSNMKVPYDFVIVGAGVNLNTNIAREAGLQVEPSGGIIVNEELQTSDPDIYAAGDVAYFKDRVLGKAWHAEHFLNARWQGRTAGVNLAGGNEPYDQVPYFFSDFLDLHMVLRGDPSTPKTTVILGDLDGGEFVELYHDETGRVGMAIGISRDGKKLDEIGDKLEEVIRRHPNVNDVTWADVT